MQDVDASQGESQQTACAEMQVARTLAPEQLRQFLSDHRNRLQEARRTLLWSAAQLKGEIAVIDAALAELTIG